MPKIPGGAELWGWATPEIDNGRNTPLRCVLKEGGVLMLTSFQLGQGEEILWQHVH